jgi:trehalose 6-phosphate synthase/phosphatase
MMNHSMIELEFRVKAALLVGEDMRVCGNVPALGSNDPNRSIKLFTSSSNYPYWHSKEPIFVPGDSGAVTYRYCVFSGGKFSRWEGNGDFTRTLWQDRVNNAMIVTNDDLDVVPVDDVLPVALNRTTSYRNTLQVSSFKSRQYSAWARKLQLDGSISSQDGVIIVSYFLPVILSRSALGQWSATWDEENLLSLQTNLRITWIGSVRYFGAIPIEEEDRVSAVLSEFNCYPIFINQSMHYKFYDIFCKQTLWPVLHHIADVYGPSNQSDFGAKAQQDLWFTYTTVNRLFKEKVVEVYQKGDLIWIHGFHLMLLPSFLRRVLTFAKIGYFFHTPFPSSEIWRTLTRREDLLRGILSADQIGFHLYEYARHFLSTCRRVLGHGYDINASGTLAVNVDGRDVAITCIHVGVDMPRVERTLADPKFTIESSSWRARFPNKVIMAGIHRLERLKGVPLNLMAIEQFLEAQEQWRGKVVFLIIGISAKERGDDYTQTLADVKIMVNRINLRFKDPAIADDIVVYFEERSEIEMRLLNRLAFLSVADVLMITAIRCIHTLD